MEKPNPAWTEGQAALKRLFDIGAAVLGLIVCLPLLPLIAVAIKCDSSGPVFFRQIRVGRHGAPFRIVKLRTMRHAAKGAGPNFTSGRDARITRVGAWLRAAKIDELPQLFNVLKGDMSMVGPRPETPDLLQHYTAEQQAVLLSVRPGLTDYASILLRNEGALLDAASDPALFYREKLMPMKVELCRLYLSEIGLHADMKIILMTLSALTSRGSPPALDKIAAEPALAEQMGLFSK